MDSDRIVLVGVIWTLLLLGLLVLRELLKVSGRARARWVLPTLDILVVVMICAATLTAVLRLTSILGPPVTTAGADPSPVLASPSSGPTGSPTPMPVPTVAPTPAAGSVTLPAALTVYRVSGDRVASYRTIRARAGSNARASAPRVYAMPTLGDPSATRRLVRITSGPFAGAWVSPQDAGVTLTQE